MLVHLRLGRREHGTETALDAFRFEPTQVALSAVKPAVDPKKYRLAMNSEEYVPSMKPTMRANAKSLIVPVPSAYVATTTSNVVPEVRIVRLSVSFSAVFVVFSMSASR